MRAIPKKHFLLILVLWAVLVLILVRYWKLDRLAALLWIPYVAWVTFAAFLNGAIWSLNR